MLLLVPNCIEFAHQIPLRHKWMFLCLNENYQKMPNKRCLMAETSVYVSDVSWLADDNYSCSLPIEKLLYLVWILDLCALHIASARMLYCTHRAVGKSKVPGGGGDE